MGQEQLALLNELYRDLRLYANYFQPVMKLKRKERNGSQVKKTYHPAQTPSQRLRGSKYLSGAGQQRLKREYEHLNPAALKRKIERLQNKLLQLAAHNPGTATPATVAWLDQSLSLPPKPATRSSTF